MVQCIGKLRVGAAVASSIVFASAAHATLSFSSDPGIEGLGSFTGSVAWTYGGGSSGTLVYSLTNTSPLANGGYLTGFAFNAVAGVTCSLSSAPASWTGMADVAASPFPNFDFGAALGGDWLGGGSPNAGIAVGAGASFSFSVSGSAGLLAGLTDASFFDPANGYAFAARFRGFANGGSDKVTGSVPAPGALGLLAISAGIGTRRRRREG